MKKTHMHFYLENELCKPRFGKTTNIRELWCWYF